jgi:FkbM family methyltransferase
MLTKKLSPLRFAFVLFVCFSFSQAYPFGLIQKNKTPPKYQPDHTDSKTTITRLDETHESVLQFVQKYLPTNPTIVEAGAFDGSDSIRMIKFWPTAKLHAFEPVSQIFHILEENVRSNTNISCYNLALGDFTGKTNFYVADYLATPGLSQSSSVLPPKDHLIYDRNVAFSRTESVNIVLLDEWAAKEGIDSIDFMWLDMQGYELNMLQCSKLALTARVIYTELEFVEAYAGQFLYQDVINWMEKNQFELIAADFEMDQPFAKIDPAPGYPPGKAYYGNAVFLNTRYLLNERI